MLRIQNIDGSNRITWKIGEPVPTFPKGLIVIFADGSEKTTLQYCLPEPRSHFGYPQKEDRFGTF